MSSMQSKTDSDMTGKTSILDSLKKKAAFKTISEETDYNPNVVVRSTYSLNTREQMDDQESEDDEVRISRNSQVDYGL